MNEHARACAHIATQMKSCQMAIDNNKEFSMIHAYKQLTTEVLHPLQGQIDH